MACGYEKMDQARKAAGAMAVLLDDPAFPGFDCDEDPCPRCEHLNNIYRHEPEED